MWLVKGLYIHKYIKHTYTHTYIHTYIHTSCQGKYDVASKGPIHGAEAIGRDACMYVCMYIHIYYKCIHGAEAIGRDVC